MEDSEADLECERVRRQKKANSSNLKTVPGDTLTPQFGLDKIISGISFNILSLVSELQKHLGED
jgi:hypothetical protein